MHAVRPHAPRLLLVSMYPLDRGRWGPTVRIAHLRDELAALTRLDVVSGYRGRRRLALVRYAASGRLRGLDGIYVESSTFLPAEADIAFLGLARGLGIPVLTYVRDAYQLFPDYAAQDGRRPLRRRIAAAAFRPALWALRRVSSRIAAPTDGLARAVLGERHGGLLLPPGAPPPVEVPRAEGAADLLFVGNAAHADHGVDRLVAAVRHVRAEGTPVGLTVVCRPGEEPPGEPPEWLRIERGDVAEIHALLPRIVATVIPRPRSAYNDLALPVKLMDYLSYGRPLIVTDCLEQARVVRDAEAGIVTGDDPLAIAAGIRQVLTAELPEIERWSRNGHAAARSASWAHRARAIVDALGVDA